MIALIIVGVIFALLAVVLFLPITAEVSFDGEFLFKIKCLGIMIFDNKKIKKAKKTKGKKQNSNQSNAKAPKKEGFFKKTYKQKGLIGTITYFSEIASFILKKLLWLLKRFKFRRFKLDITVASHDAATTAIQYGKVCAAVYPVISLLQTAIDFKPNKLDISADFKTQKPSVMISVLVKTRVLYLIIATLGVLSQFIKLQRKEREKYERKQSENRNGYHDGEASHNG